MAEKAVVTIDFCEDFLTKIYFCDGLFYLKEKVLVSIVVDSFI